MLYHLIVICKHKTGLNKRENCVLYRVFWLGSVANLWEWEAAYSLAQGILTSISVNWMQLRMQLSPKCPALLRERLDDSLVIKEFRRPQTIINRSPSTHTKKSDPLFDQTTEVNTKKKPIQPFIPSLLKKKEVYFATAVEGISTKTGHYSTPEFPCQNTPKLSHTQWMWASMR